MASPPSSTQHKIAVASVVTVALLGTAGIVWVAFILSGVLPSLIASACLASVAVLSLAFCLFGVCVLVYAIMDNPCLF